MANGNSSTPKIEKTLELKVGGRVVGTVDIYIDSNQNISRVRGEGLLRHGSYLMTPDQLKEMVERNFVQKNPNVAYELSLRDTTQKKAEDKSYSIK